MSSDDLKIGGIDLSTPLLLAPMAGISDLPFRKLCRNYGASIAFAEMVASDPSLRNTPKSRLRCDFRGEPGPRAAQLVGNDPERMAQSARYLVDQGVQIIDINLGCPVKKLTSKCQGAWLLQDLDLIVRLFEAVIDAVNVPVTVKIRSGWRSVDNVAVEVAQIAQQAGLAAVTVHGRSAQCGYDQPAEYQTVSQVKRSVDIPVIANGDIDSAQKAMEVLSKTQVDGLMIGRGVFGRPWIFREICAMITEGKELKPVALSEIHAILISHLQAIYEFYGERQGVRIARKHIGWYIERSSNSNRAAACNEIYRTDFAARQLQLVDDLFNQLEDENGSNWNDPKRKDG